MPFGLNNIGQMFQCLMNCVLKGLPFVFVYTDNILVASKEREDHLDHLKTLSTHLQEHGLIIRPENCHSFLGHFILTGGISPLPEKVLAV